MLQQRQMKFFLRLILILMLIVIRAELAMAQTIDRRQPYAPRDMSKVEVYLGTRDVGHSLHTKYGHTIMRILDTATGSDIGYNWGTFDFNAPGYIPNSLRGILIYYMSYDPWHDEVRISQYERQTMWMEQVNLTDNQKQRLIDRILWQARPENVNYPYLFFYDNCSTRVRDLFDLAVRGQIRARSMSKFSGKTYRDRVMEHNSSAPFFAMSQDIILNSEPDRKMTEWDDMFVPGKLRDYLLTMPAFDDQGNEIQGKTFLSDTRELTRFPKPEITPINGYMLIWLIAGIPAMFGMLLSRKFSQIRLGARMIGLSAIVPSVSSCVYAE